MRFAPRLLAAAALLLPGLLPASPTDDKFQATAKAFLERYLARCSGILLRTTVAAGPKGRK